MKNPKQKGTDFELIVAKRLSRWYDPHTKVDYFWRTHGSGTVATVRKVGCEVMEGDIMSIREETHELFNYVVIECKRVRSLDLLTFLDRKNCDVIGLYESSRAKVSSSKVLFLIVKRDYGDTLILMPLLLSKIQKCVVVKRDSMSLYLYRLEDVLSMYSYTEFLSLIPVHSSLLTA